MIKLENIKKAIKSRLGELWWYTAVLFIAQQLGSVINAFIGLWLVPQYVPKEELGAVLPMLQVGSILGLPVAIMLIPFGKYLNIYLVNGELGKIKSMLRDVVYLTFAFGVIIIVLGCYVMPGVFVRLRIQDGILTWLIILSSIMATIFPLFAQALQGLKKFRAISVLTISYPFVRLITMVITLPIRGLSGYFCGGLVADSFGIAATVISLRNLISRKIPFVSYLPDVREITRYTVPIALLLIAGRIQCAAEFFIIRHRLPDIESAAYYFVTRFSEIPNSLWAALSVAFFPMVSEQFEKGKQTDAIYKHALMFILVGGGLMTICFHFFAPCLFSLTDVWKAYLPYAHLMGVATATCVLRAAFACFQSRQMACRKSGFIVYTSIIYCLEALVLYAISGINFFRGYLPDVFIDYIQSLNLMRLDCIVWIIFFISAGMCLLTLIRVKSIKSVCHQLKLRLMRNVRTPWEGKVR
jgi:O-antigen/teichoic acid export membrane protein